MELQADFLDVELLILKVKEHPPIYDACDKNHGNRNFIAALWRKIGDELSIPGPLVKDKWHQLRSNYMRVKRNERNKPFGSATKTKIRWSHYDLMSFLDQYSEPRGDSLSTSDKQVDISFSIKQELRPQGHLVSDESECETASNSEDTTLTAVTYTENEMGDNADRTERINQNKRRIEPSEVDDVDFQHLLEYRKNHSPLPDENDSDKMFLLSLLPSMKKLSPSDSMSFKLNALQFLRSKLYPTALNN